MPIARARPWHVAAVTQGRVPYFARFAAGAAVGCELALMEAAGLWDVLAWVLLPRRFDAVIAPLRGRLDDTVPRFLGHAAERAARAQNDPRPVWAKRFAYQPLASEALAEETARAILRKPLRAELVERLADYPFWDSVWLGVVPRAPAVPCFVSKAHSVGEHGSVGRSDFIGEAACAGELPTTREERIAAVTVL